MACLSDQEIQRYQRNGYVIPQFRLDKAWVDRMQDALNTLIRNNPGVRPEKLVSAHIEGQNDEGVRGSRDFFELAMNPDIVDLVAQVLGPDVILWGCHVFCKPASEGYETPWHQDGHYWPSAQHPSKGHEWHWPSCEGKRRSLFYALINK